MGGKWYDYQKQRPSQVTRVGRGWPPMRRFFHFVPRRPVGDCWPWMGTLNNDGYGQITISPGPNKVAHRWVWELLKGSIPDDQHIDHICRRRDCVNPQHMEIVSHAENCRRDKERRRSQGVKYVEKGSGIVRESKGA